jgi:hypothetical protein
MHRLKLLQQLLVQVQLQERVQRLVLGLLLAREQPQRQLVRLGLFLQAF